MSILLDVSKVAGSNTEMQYNNGGQFGGAKVYYNDSTEFVGIGTAPTNGPLEVNKSVADKAVIYANNTNATSYGMFLRGGGSDAAHYVLASYDKDSNAAIICDGDTNVGIKTASPGAALDVRGDAFFGSTEGTLFFNSISLNSGYTINSVYDTRINYNGYQAGTTQWRNLIIYDGKNTPVVTVSGANADIYSTAFTDYTSSSTIVGWSSTTTEKIFYKKLGKLVHVWFNIVGTSDSTSTTFTLPHTSKNTSGYTTAGATVGNDNGTYKVITFDLGSNSNTVNLHNGIPGTAWTASGTKIIQGFFFYEID